MSSVMQLTLNIIQTHQRARVMPRRYGESIEVAAKYFASEVMPACRDLLSNPANTVSKSGEVSTIPVLNLFDETRECICIFYHFLVFKWDKIFFNMPKIVMPMSVK